MLKIIKDIFEKLNKIEGAMRKEYFGTFNGSFILLLSIIVFCALGYYINDYFHVDIVMNISVFMMASFIYIIIPFAVFKEGEVKKFILFGRKEKFEDVIKDFSIKSYIVFVCVFSYLLSYPVIGIPLFMKIFNFNFVFSFVMANINGVLYINMVFASIAWFSYHIVYLTVSLQKIRGIIALYIAIGSTASLIFNINNIEDAAFIMSCLLVSYFWIQYLIELKDAEISNVKKEAA